MTNLKKLKIIQNLIKSNIPICPGISNITKLNSDDLKNKCENIGYPLLVKSSAGGGGIGMSVVQNFKDLSKSIEKTWIPFWPLGV